jgi:hypothetical protein
VPMPWRLTAGALAAAAIAGAAGWAVHRYLPLHYLISAAVALVLDGVIYLALMLAARVPEARTLLRRGRGRHHEQVDSGR